MLERPDTWYLVGEKLCWQEKGIFFAALSVTMGELRLANCLHLRNQATLLL
jgi:hypothetical protein